MYRAVIEIVRREAPASRIMLPITFSILILVIISTVNLSISGIASSSAAVLEGPDGINYRIISKWTWLGSEQGYVMDIVVDVGKGVVYALSTKRSGVVIYEINLETGSLIGRVEINLTASYGHLRLAPTVVEVILIGDNNNVTIASVDVEASQFNITGNLSIRDFRVRVVDAIKIGMYTVVAGAKAEVNGSLGFYIAAFDGLNSVWEDAWYASGDGYYITVKTTSDGGVCAAGVGGYACYTMDGSKIFTGTINGTILAMDAPTSNAVVLAGVDSSGTGFIMLVKDGVIEWNTTLGTLVPSAVAYANGLIYVAGEALTSTNRTTRHNLAVALLDAAGEVEIIGLEEANGTVLIPTIKTLTPTTIIIGGSIDSTPFAKKLQVEEPENPTETTTSQTQSTPITTTTTGTLTTQNTDLQKVVMQYYISILLTIISAILLAIVAFNLYRKRKNRI